jgi:hypothetical protein
MTDNDVLTERLVPPSTAFDPEAYVGELAEHWTGPHPAECLYCYLSRVLDEFGCRGSHEWTQRWCDAQSFDTGWVLPWVQREGGCCCDCEVVMNVWAGGRSSPKHRQLKCARQGCRAGRGGR